MQRIAFHLLRKGSQKASVQIIFLDKKNNEIEITRNLEKSKNGSISQKNGFVKNKTERLKTIRSLGKENYDLFIQLPQNLGLYKSIRNILIVRFVLKIKDAFGWDHGRIKSFIKTQKRAAKLSYLSSSKSYYPTETMRLVHILKTHGLEGDVIYPVKKTTSIDKTLI